MVQIRNRPFYIAIYMVNYDVEVMIWLEWTNDQVIHLNLPFHIPAHILRLVLFDVTLLHPLDSIRPRWESGSCGIHLIVLDSTLSSKRALNFYNFNFCKQMGVWRNFELHFMPRKCLTAISAVVHLAFRIPHLQWNFKFSIFPHVTQGVHGGRLVL